MFTNWSCHPLKLDDCTSYGLLMITWNKHVPVRIWRLWRDLFEKISPGSILWTSQTPRSKSSSSRTWDFIILVMRDAGMLKVKKSLLIFNWIFYQDLNVNTFFIRSICSSLLALIGFPTELCNHVCVGPGPGKNPCQGLFCRALFIKHLHIVWYFGNIVIFWKPILAVVEICRPP